MQSLSIELDEVAIPDFSDEALEASCDVLTAFSENCSSNPDPDIRNRC
jgi:hypothetical protein